MIKKFLKSVFIVILFANITINEQIVNAADKGESTATVTVLSSETEEMREKEATPTVKKNKQETRSTQKKRLPQTSEQKKLKYIIIGIFLLVIVLVGYTINNKMRRKKYEENEMD